MASHVSSSGDSGFKLCRHQVCHGEPREVDCFMRFGQLWFFALQRRDGSKLSAEENLLSWRSEAYTLEQVLAQGPSAEDQNCPCPFGCPLSKLCSG